MSDERYTVILGDRRYAVHRKWARPEQPFGFLSDLMVDDDGRVHVAQRGNSQPVVVFDRDGRQVGAWGEGTLAEPHYINRSADGGILVADRDAHQVLRFGANGQLVQALGKRQDEIISTLVKDRFAKSATLKAANFEVKTEEGVVSLSGAVRFQVLALEAAEAARLVPGVRAVKTDRIRLGGEG